MTYEEFLNAAKEKKIEDIQITTDTNIEKEVYYVNDKLEDYTDTNHKSYLIKGKYAGKVEEVSAEYLDESILDLLIEKINLTDSNYANEFIESSQNTPKIEPIKISINSEMDKIKSLYDLKKQYPQVKNMEFVFEESFLETRIINNKNVDISTSSHTYHFVVQANSENEGSSASFYKSILATNKNDIQFEEMTKKALEYATILAQKEKLKTKKYPVIIDSTVVTEILLSLKNMLAAESIHKKVSCLTDKLNKPIFGKELTIVEEPLNKKYPGYTVFDKEGVPTINKEIIKKGVLKTYLYRNKEAKVDNVKSTGNNYIQTSTRNMYILPGTKSVEEKIAEIQDGIYITDNMGAIGTSINESTGNISIQVFGFIIKNGKITTGFVPAVMSTTIFELFSNIDEVLSDLTFRRKEVGAPSLYVTDISIAGE